MEYAEKKIIKKSIRITESANRFVERCEGNSFNDKLDRLFLRYQKMENLQDEIERLEQRKKELDRLIAVLEECIGRSEAEAAGETLKNLERMKKEIEFWLKEIA